MRATSSSRRRWRRPTRSTSWPATAAASICLALTKERADHLGLEPMARTNRSRNETAFTVSIEAKDGISTGISAADRARTIAVAIDSAHGPDFDRLARPRLPAGRPARRRAGPRRPYRGGGRRLPARRAQPQRGDLRDHERRRDHGPARQSDGLRARPQPQGRHDPRPHRLPPEEGSHGRAGRLDQVHRRFRRDMGGAGVPRQGQRRRAARFGPRHARHRPAGAGADAQPRPVRRRARRSGRAQRRVPGRDADDRAGRLGRASSRCMRPRPARCRGRPTCARARAPKPARRSAAMGLARRSSPRSASTT